MTEIDRYIEHCISRVPQERASDFDPKLGIVKKPSQYLSLLLLPQLSGSKSIYGEKDLYMLIVTATIHKFECISGITVNRMNASLITIYALLMLLKAFDEEHYTNINHVWADALSMDLDSFNRLEAIFLFKAKGLLCIPTYEESMHFIEDFKAFQTTSSQP